MFYQKGLARQLKSKSTLLLDSKQSLLLLLFLASIAITDIAMAKMAQALFSHLDYGQMPIYPLVY